MAENINIKSKSKGQDRILDNTLRDLLQRCYLILFQETEINLKNYLQLFWFSATMKLGIVFYMQIDNYVEPHIKNTKNL